MIYEHLLEWAGDKRIHAGLIGTGAYGTSLLAQAQSISHLEVPIVCDRDIKAAQRACQQAGITEEAITVCDSRKEALAVIEAGKCVITQDHALLMDLPLEVIVECTGNPEAGARHADLAIKHGKHVAMVNKETDSVVGPMLHRLAKDRGVVYTPVDGDQHGLLIGLVSWARKIGLEVVCGGKAHARDFVYDEAARTVTDGITEKTLYRPYHLLGVETPISILCAGLLNVSTGGLTVEPRVDLVARTACDLKAGSIINVIDEGSAVAEGSDAILEPLITPSISVEDAGPVPLHMATGNRLSVDVSAGAVLTTEMIEKPPASRLWALRREQDRVFQITQGSV